MRSLLDRFRDVLDLDRVLPAEARPSQHPGGSYPVAFPLIREAAIANLSAQLIKRLRDGADGFFQSGCRVDVITHNELQVSVFV